MLFNILAFSTAYIIMFLILTYGVERVVVYPSELNLSRVYQDDKGTCYRYERHSCECQGQ